MEFEYVKIPAVLLQARHSQEQSKLFLDAFCCKECINLANIVRMLSLTQVKRWTPQYLIKTVYIQ